MFGNKILIPRGWALLLIGAVSAAGSPAYNWAGPAAPKGNMIGSIYLTDLKSPLAGAVVKIRSVKDGSEAQSEPTDQNGNYKLLGIQEGQYVLGVSAKNGDYNLEVLIQIKGGETGKLSLILKEGQASAVLAKSAPKPAFFRTPLGLAVLAGASAAAVVAGVTMINSPTPAPASPSKK